MSDSCKQYPEEYFEDGPPALPDLSTIVGYFNVDGEPISRNDWLCLSNLAEYCEIADTIISPTARVRTRWFGDAKIRDSYRRPVIFETCDLFGFQIWSAATVDEALENHAHMVEYVTNRRKRSSYGESGNPPV